MEGHQKFLGGGGGGGVLEAKILEAKYEAELEFPGGMGVQNKNPSVGGGGGGMDIIFWNCTLSVADNNKRLILVNGKCLHLPKVNYDDIITKIL